MIVDVTVSGTARSFSVSGNDVEFSTDTDKSRALSIAGLLGDCVGQVLLEISGKGGVSLDDVLTRFQNALSDTMR